MPYLLSKIKLIALLGLGSVIVHSQSMLMGYDVGQSGDWRLPLSPVRIPPQLGTGVAGGWGEKVIDVLLTYLFKHPMTATLTLVMS